MADERDDPRRELRLEGTSLLAVGGAPDYRTDGIPHGWLVSPQGSIVWEGHPASLTNGTIEEHLKGVRMAPSPDLPKELYGEPGADPIGFRHLVFGVSPKICGWTTPDAMDVPTTYSTLRPCPS